MFKRSWRLFECNKDTRRMSEATVEARIVVAI